MRPHLATNGLLGFDVNEPVGLTAARSLHDLGYRFALRYIRRHTKASSDLSPAELATLFQAGLGVMPVQHVESETSWVPDGPKGATYGANAVEACKELGFPAGTTCWLDLEGVDPLVQGSAIIAYCNAWYDEVKSAGFQPGLYIGWHAGLSPETLYLKLRFQRYWSAYNLNLDQFPAIRGVCMRQSLTNSPVSLAIDRNRIIADNLGGVPTLAVPDEWAP